MQSVRKKNIFVGKPAFNLTKKKKNIHLHFYVHGLFKYPNANANYHLSFDWKPQNYRINYERKYNSIKEKSAGKTRGKWEEGSLPRKKGFKK